MKFSNNWFDITARNTWDNLVDRFKPNRYLEIGSYEGASACYIIEKCGKDRDLDIVCIDTWEGGEEHIGAGIDMSEVEMLFRENTKEAISGVTNNINLNTIKDTSLRALSGLNVSGQFDGAFDMIYVDGSHIATDVLADAILAFPLLKSGGLMVFDDYPWTDSGRLAGKPLETPKLAVDMFSLFYSGKAALLNIGPQASFVKMSC